MAQTPQQLDRRASNLATINPDSIPAVQIGDPVLFAPGCGHTAVGGRIVAGPDENGYWQAEYAGPARLCLDHGQDWWLEPGGLRSVAWGDGLAGLLLEDPAGPYGNTVAEGRVVRPAPAVQIVREEVERVIRPSQPEPATPEAEARRRRAGNTVRRTGAGSRYVPINVDAQGQRFTRVQLTTKLRPEARTRLDEMAKASGLRVCEVLEDLILGSQEQAAPAAASPAVDRTGERRTRLTKAEAQKLDTLLAGLIRAGRTGKADLERVAAAMAADGLPAQGVPTLRTRIRRLQQQADRG